MDRQIELLVRDNSKNASAVWAYKLKINWSGSKIYSPRMRGRVLRYALICTYCVHEINLGIYDQNHWYIHYYRPICLDYYYQFLMLYELDSSN